MYYFRVVYRISAISASSEEVACADIADGLRQAGHYSYCVTAERDEDADREYQYVTCASMIFGSSSDDVPYSFIRSVGEEIAAEIGVGVDVGDVVSLGEQNHHFEEQLALARVVNEQGLSIDSVPELGAVGIDEELIGLLFD